MAKMATQVLAIILKNPFNESEFLLSKQTPPPKFGDEEYDSYVDSDLWDLPSTELNLLEGESDSRIVLESADMCPPTINLKRLDLESALNEVFEYIGLSVGDAGEWTFLKYVEEAEFGPGLPVNTLFVTGKLMVSNQNLPEQCKWMSIPSCQSWLIDVKANNSRIGLLVVVGLVNDSTEYTRWKVPHALKYQEYPPGVQAVPFNSRTAKPFRTTNLIVFSPEKSLEEFESSNFVACGEALIVDPGCHQQSHEELMEVIAALPRKLIVLVTHHHRDHVDGLSIVQKCNPDATLLAHENTMRRIEKEDWSLGYTLISGSEEICIGGQTLRIIFAPGHTDGHVALLHVSTHSLIVGDHCVGQGSSALDITAGANMTDYFQTTYRFMELAPHVLIPMHGRVNMWPKHMLCGYLKNRRSREAAVLKAIENGATTLLDIVADVYSDVDKSFWFGAASNVRLHVDHLAQQDKLPEGFSLETYRSSFDAFYEEMGKFEPK